MIRIPLEKEFYVCSNINMNYSSWSLSSFQALYNLTRQCLHMDKQNLGIPSWQKKVYLANKLFWCVKLFSHMRDFCSRLNLYASNNPYLRTWSLYSASFCLLKPKKSLSTLKKRIKLFTLFWYSNISDF
jgi:hypothetical protein